MALPDGPPKASGQKLVKAKKTPQNNVTPLKTVKKSWKKIFDKLKVRLQHIMRNWSFPVRIGYWVSPGEW